MQAGARSRQPRAGLHEFAAATARRRSPPGTRRARRPDIRTTLLVDGAALSAAGQKQGGGDRLGRGGDTPLRELLLTHRAVHRGGGAGRVLHRLRGEVAGRALAAHVQVPHQPTTVPRPPHVEHGSIVCRVSVRWLPSGSVTISWCVRSVTPRPEHAGQVRSLMMLQISGARRGTRRRGRRACGPRR